MGARHARPYHQGAATRQRFRTLFPRLTKQMTAARSQMDFWCFSTPFFDTFSWTPASFRLPISRAPNSQIQYPIYPRFLTKKNRSEIESLHVLFEQLDILLAFDEDIF